MDNWTRRPYGNPLRLDGQEVVEAGIVPLAKEPSPGASILPMADGGTLYQCPLSDLAGQKPQIVSAYRWPLTLQADTEEGWFLLESCSKRGRSVELIDFDYAVESFLVGVSLTSFLLPRPTAESTWGSFPAVDYPTQAYINGTAQTVVAATPGAGEVQIVGRAVTTPTLTAGDVLEIHYIPSYQVVVPPIPHELRRYADLVARIDLTELLNP